MAGEINIASGLANRQTGRTGLEQLYI
jgi:hypothetical protein